MSEERKEKAGREKQPWHQVLLRTHKRLRAHLPQFRNPTMSGLDKIYEKALKRRNETSDWGKHAPFAAGGGGGNEQISRGGQIKNGRQSDAPCWEESDVQRRNKRGEKGVALLGELKKFDLTKPILVPRGGGILMRHYAGRLIYCGAPPRKLRHGGNGVPRSM